MSVGRLAALLPGWSARARGTLTVPVEPTFERIRRRVTRSFLAFALLTAWVVLPALSVLPAWGIAGVVLVNTVVTVQWVRLERRPTVRPLWLEAAEAVALGVVSVATMNGTGLLGAVMFASCFGTPRQAVRRGAVYAVVLVACYGAWFAQGLLPLPVLVPRVVLDVLTLAAGAGIAQVVTTALEQAAQLRRRDQVLSVLGSELTTRRDVDDVLTRAASALASVVGTKGTSLCVRAADLGTPDNALRAAPTDLGYAPACPDLDALLRRLAPDVDGPWCCQQVWVGDVRIALLAVSAPARVHADLRPSVELLAAQIATAAARSAAEDELQRRSERDDLTGLLKWSVLERRLCAAPSPPQALLFIDLDDFKQVNDVRGHLVGDAVLVEVARRLQATVRATDTVARLGGDEFVVSVEDGETDLSGLVGRLQEQLSRPVQAGRLSVPIAASIGVGRRDPAGGQTLRQLLQLSDQAMYATKGVRRAGREAPARVTG